MSTARVMEFEQELRIRWGAAITDDEQAAVRLWFVKVFAGGGVEGIVRRSDLTPFLRQFWAEEVVEIYQAAPDRRVLVRERQARWRARQRGYKPGWERHKYREKFGEWPPWGVTPKPQQPTAEVRAWVRSRLIA